MKRIALVAIGLLLLAVPARADGGMGGLGFRTLNAVGGPPSIGIRQWANERVGFDAAIGFGTIKIESGTPLVTTDESTGFSFDVGVPVSMKQWDRVNVIVRPGFTYSRGTDKDKTSTTPPNEFKITTYSVAGEIEVEWMVAEKLSVSAAHGIAYQSFKGEDNDTPVNEFKSTVFRSIGNNFTTLGFHVYLW